MKSIFVGNLPFSATEEEIADLFSQHGPVHSVRIINDRETGRPRGFAFVKMDDENAATAVNAINGSSFGGRNLRVNEAEDRPPQGGGQGANRPTQGNRPPRNDFRQAGGEERSSGGGRDNKRSFEGGGREDRERGQKKRHFPRERRRAFHEDDEWD